MDMASIVTVEGVIIFIITSLFALTQYGIKKHLNEDKEWKKDITASLRIIDDKQDQLNLKIANQKNTCTKEFAQKDDIKELKSEVNHLKNCQIKHLQKQG